MDEPPTPVVLRLDALSSFFWLQLLGFLPLKQFLRLCIVSKSIKNIKIPKSEANEIADKIIHSCSRDSDNFDWSLVIHLMWWTGDVSIGHLSQTRCALRRLDRCYFVPSICGCCHGNLSVESLDNVENEVIRSKVLQTRVNIRDNKYSHCRDVGSEFHGYSYEDTDDITFADPAEVFAIGCDSCQFLLFLWAVPCVGDVYNDEPCRRGDSEGLIPESLVIGKCGGCRENLVNCARCTHARCDTCRRYLCEECSCGMWMGTVGRNICSKCAGTRYDNLFSDY